MARSFMTVLTSIWGDPQFRQLSGSAQRLYFLLGSQNRLTLAGCLDLMPARWAHLSVDTSAVDIEVALDELASARFVAVDRATEEVVIRTFVRHDLDNHRLNVNLVKGLWAAWAGILSPTLRKVVVDHMPEVMWERDGASVPDEAQQMRRSPRLELPVPTGGSDGPSARSAETVGLNGPSEQPSPVTTHLSPSPVTSSRGEREPRGMSDPPGEPRAAAVDNSVGRLTAEERQKRLAEAVELLVSRELARNPTRNGNADRHASGVRRGKLADHHQAGHRVLSEQPDLTAEALADRLEPPPSEFTPAGERINHTHDGHQRAMRDQAAAGMATVHRLADEQPDPDRVARIAELKRAARLGTTTDAEGGAS